MKSVQDRIIPTRMGTRLTNAIKNSTAQDHPHAYGDKKHGLLQGRRDTGSSPRVWGQDSFSSATEIADRIIPTRMGTSKEAYLRVMIL